MKAEIEKNGWPDKVSVGLIGSCTNSSFEDISRAASVVRNVLDAGIIANAELKVSPGSEAIRQIADKYGLLDLFKKAGAVVYSNACGPCIGQWDRKGADKKEVNTVIHSFNRNFSKRTDGNPNTYAFVASPEIVTAITLAGHLSFNPLTDTIVNSEGKKVNLPEPRGSDLPAGEMTPGIKKSKKKHPGGKAEITVDPESERIQLLKPFEEWDGTELTGLPLLIKAKGKCTTDHISMAGKWLKYRGHLENISRNYMIGAVNFFNGEADSVLNRASKKQEPVPDVASFYKRKFKGSIVAGEENFGEGSSREHAAMEPRFFKVRAIIVKSFARIHETNLKKQGVLTLTFSDKSDYDRIREDDMIDITGLREFLPGKPFTVVLHHSDGTDEKFPASHSYNAAQIEWFREGSALNLIRKKGSYRI
jgi:aconitate hydratase